MQTSKSVFFWPRTERRLASILVMQCVRRSTGKHATCFHSGVSPGNFSAGGPKKGDAVVTDARQNNTAPGRNKQLFVCTMLDVIACMCGEERDWWACHLWICSSRLMLGPASSSRWMENLKPRDSWRGERGEGALEESRRDRVRAE